MKNKIFIFLILILSFRLAYSQEPDKYHNEINHKCATFVFQGNKDKLLRAIHTDDNGRPKVGQKTLITQSKKFKLHYDTSGIHSVPIADLNANGIPDYIDTASYYIDYIYKVQVDSMGFKSPYPDEGIDGDEYDIYFYDLGNSDFPNLDDFDEGGNYGFATTTEIIESNGKFPKYHSYITVDNDYSTLDSSRKLNQDGTNYDYSKSRQAYFETGLTALKITLAHEFHHSVQFLYGVSYPTGTMISEMTASSMEFRIFPETKDYTQWTKLLFSKLANYTFGDDSQNSGYCYSIFIKHIQEKYGFVKSDLILKNLQLNIENGINSYNSLDSALKIYNSSLVNELIEFSDWVFYTGNRAKDNYGFKNAAIMPEVTTVDYKFLDTTIFKVGSLLPLETRILRVKFSAINEGVDETFDIILTNKDLESASAVSQRKSSYQLIVDNKKNDDKLIQLGNSKYYYFFDCDEKNNANIIIKTVEKIEKSYPNPVNLSKDTKVYFPAPKTSKIGDKVVLNIFSKDMVPVKNNLIEAYERGSKLILEMDVNNLGLETGVYIFQTENKDDSLIGKFVVIGK